MKKNKINTSILGLMIFFLLINNLFTFGISSTYWKEHDLEISPGETHETKLTIQNMAGTEDLNVAVRILKGSEILEIIDRQDNYFIPLGTKKQIDIRVSIPETAKVGDIYPVELDFSTISQSQSGEFGFGSAVGQKFDVVIIPTEEQRKLMQEKPKMPTISIILGILIVLLVIVIIIIFRKKKKTKRKVNYKKKK